MTTDPTTIAELAIKHDYYCSESNYLANPQQDPSPVFDTLADFLDDYESFDIDLNLCFRWDVKPKTDEDGVDAPELGYSAEVFLIQQRKGHFVPIQIKNASDSDVPRFVAYLRKHQAKLLQLWSPL